VLLLAWILVSIGHGIVRAQTSCQVTATENYPRQALPGASLQVATLVAGQCFSALVTIDSYVIRVDITNPYSAVLSSNSSFTGYGSQVFSTTVLNTVTAPTSPTSWSLKVHVYVSVTGDQEPDYSSIDTIIIQVGSPFTPSTITTVVQITTQPTTETTQTEIVYSSTVPSQALEGLAILLTMIALTLTIALAKSRRRYEKTRVY